MHSYLEAWNCYYAYIEDSNQSPCAGLHVVAVWFSGDLTSIAKKPYIFVIFQGGTLLPPPPSGSAHGLRIRIVWPV